MKLSRSEFLNLRNMRFHIRHWGNEGDPKLFLLHGWMDSSVTFQFLVDAFKQNWHAIALDWRGFGYSSYSPNGYWYPDYLADLEAVLKHYSADKPVRLIGHSMGGNIACHYAGIRPDRVQKLISLEGYGIMRMTPDQATDRYRRWLDSLDHINESRVYSDFESVVERIMRNNPKLTNERAKFIASNWAKRNQNGTWQILADPLHRRVNPIMMRMDEVLETWKLITAPTLMIDSEYSLLGMRMGDYEKGREEIRRRAAVIPNVTVAMIKDAGHMVQHDQPEITAELIEKFLFDTE